MKNFSESTIWESNHSNQFEILEAASSEVDGEHILAKVRGPAFFPNTTSRNKVFYPLEAWENAIADEELKTKLEDRLVFGSIGHNTDLTDDDVREGRLSHIVTNVWIGEDNIGYGEYLILNTPPGRILNTLFRARSKLRVSTKASGFFENGPTPGVKSVIPDSFTLERIDFVIDPGYLQARPDLLESLQQDEPFINQLLTGSNNMTDKAISILESRVTELTQEKKISESVAADLQKELRQISEAHAVQTALLDNYKQLGSYPALQESLAELSQYHAIGSVQEVHEALEEGEEVLTDMANTINDLQTTITETPDEYEELGEPSEIKQALDQALAVVDELEQYKELGTVEEINQLIDNATAMAEAQEEAESQAVADTYGVPVETVTGLLGKGMSLEEVKSLLDTIKPVAAVGESDDDEDDEDKPEGEVSSDAADAVTPPPAADAPTDTPPADGGDPDKEDEEEKEDIPESRSSAALRRMRGDKLPVAIKESRSTTVSRVARLMAGTKK